MIFFPKIIIEKENFVYKISEAPMFSHDFVSKLLAPIFILLLLLLFSLFWNFREGTKKDLTVRKWTFMKVIALQFNHDTEPDANKHADIGAPLEMCRRFWFRYNSQCWKIWPCFFFPKHLKKFHRRRHGQTDIRVGENDSVSRLARVCLRGNFLRECYCTKW